MLLLCFACAQGQAAEAIEITHAHIESTEDGYRLASTFAFDLNQELEAALQHGVPLTFKTEISLTRPRWYWKDERAVETSQTARIWYDVLTRQYSVRVTSGSQRSITQTYPTLEDAMVLIHRPSRWLIASRGQLKTGETYNVQLRMFMDRDTFSKPMQVNALNNSDWRLNSREKRFVYRAE